jgi:DNA repair ATPase RecN
MLGFMSPRLWLMVGVGAFVAIGSFWAIHAWNGMIRSIKAEVALECNAKQLEEELEFEKRKVADLEERERILQGIIDSYEPEVIERVEFRDRVVTEIREVESEVNSTEEGRIREELSPTTRLFLDNLMGEE